jgi:tRNA uridine 5-carbamoylmethylation protein Kti12
MNKIQQTSQTQLIVLTGGPGAGKTAILEMAKKLFTEKEIILPEAASIIFAGGFLRLPSLTARTAAQRAIFHVQKELETLVCEENIWTMGLCDRGTLDGLAYWPNSDKSFWKMSASSLEKELSRYYAVIHLRSPTDQLGYNHTNPLRIESALQSHVIDEKIASIWKGHPRYIVVDSNINFLAKAQIALNHIAEFQSACCRSNSH